MSKGKLILTDIQSPVEGMQVVIKHFGYWVICTIGKRITLTTAEAQGTLSGNLLYGDYPISELKQIVVREYDGKRPAYRELPLHPNDWKWGIEHIGEEIKFNVCGTARNLEAKLIHPTSVTYTEEQLREAFRQGRKKFMGDWKWDEDEYINHLKKK